jgi:hypothetical protein
MNLTDEQKEELKGKIEGEKTLRRRRVIESISYRDEYSPFLSDSGPRPYLPKNKWLRILYLFVRWIVVRL